MSEHASIYSQYYSQRCFYNIIYIDYIYNMYNVNITLYIRQIVFLGVHGLASGEYRRVRVIVFW